MGRRVLEFSALEMHHQAAFADYLAEFNAAGEDRIHGCFAEADWTHAETVSRFAAWSEGRDVGEWVPSTTRFLVTSGRIIGNYNFRHELTERLKRWGGHCGYSVRPSERRRGYGTRLLEHAKEFGRSLGLERMLVTCDVHNVGSSRVIERNGGEQQDVVSHTDSNEEVARYWIPLR